MDDDKNKPAGYSIFEQDHRSFGADRPFSPSLRIKAIACAGAIGVLFWAGVWYFVA